MRKSIVLLSAALLVGCSSSDTPNYTSTLNLAFNPMYSGYDGVHPFQIPVTIDNGNGAMAVTGVKWSSSDSSMVDIQPDPTDSTGNTAMITTKKAGTVTIIATTDTAIGKSPLTITSYTPQQWAAGQTRYTQGDMTSLGMQLHGSMDKTVQCTSCHSDAPGALAIEHTPEQTGGFTDDEIKLIFMNGALPAADLEVPLYGGQASFMKFHQWMVASDDEATGLVAYLRSLTPKPQGAIDFGGRGPGGGRGDGGMRPDGFMRHHDM